jgi:hypothetical protein
MKTILKAMFGVLLLALLPLFFILPRYCCQVKAMTVDTAKWPLPDSISIKLTVYGTFNYYYDQSDGNGHNGPNNYNYNSKGSYSTPEITIVKTDSLVHYSDSTQTIVYVKSVNLSPDNDTIVYLLTLDTFFHRITSFTFHHSYHFSGIFASEITDISIKGLRYSQQKLIVEDSDITKDLIDAQYSSEGKLRPAGSEGSTLLSVDKVNISGTVNYNLLDVEQIFSSSPQLKVEYSRNLIQAILPENNHSITANLYSSLGVLAQQKRFENGTAIFSTGNLAKGLYFIIAGNLCSKVMIW